MDRLQKKCFIASAGMHLFLMLLLVLGSAFFVAKPKSSILDQMPRLQVVPGKLVDSLMSGGGGDPTLPRSNERIKGDTMRPVEDVKPPAPTPSKKVEPKPAEKVAVKPPPKPAPVPVVKKEPKPNALEARQKDILAALKPTVRKPDDKAKQENEARAREAAARTRAEARKMANLKEGLAKAFDKTSTELKAGFSDGTAVQVWGTGGEAYANYAQFVKEVYDNAWIVPIDVLDEDAITKVVVVIERSGNVVSARIQKRSGNSALDRSVQRALDNVKFVAPFPEESRDKERTFTINFNLKAKQLG